MARQIMTAAVLAITSSTLMAAADRAAPVAVSVQVVRTCTLRAGDGTVSLDCGTRGPRVVHVTVDHRAGLRAMDGTEARPALSLPSDGSAIRSLTINF